MSSFAELPPVCSRWKIEGDVMFLAVTLAVIMTFA
jgi:hypothetical protein